MRRGSLIALAIGFLLLANPASAQDSSAQDRYLDELRACQAIADDSARLACFDKSVGAIVAATQSGEVQVVEKEQLEKTRRGMFGFTLPKLGLFSGKDDLELLQSTITRVRGIRDGWIITIEEGSVWQMSNVPSRLSAPQVGDSVEFKKASLGSYFIRIDGQMGVKGRRIE
ncbi:hypothetical protein [Altererythrobacter sp. Z27]|uniref:hypothetical protein n=1 Tax=Altererythrobacter sp. Z27 TaxID=3461147 RepID=UPI004044D5D6